MQYETYDFLGGHLTIFYSKKGMTFVSLAEDPVADYQAWFGEMTVKPSQERHYGSAVSDYLAGRRVDFTPDWQGRGTELQREVWRDDDVCDISESDWPTNGCTCCRIGGG